VVVVVCAAGTRSHSVSHSVRRTGGGRTAPPPPRPPIAYACLAGLLIGAHVVDPRGDRTATAPAVVHLPGLVLPVADHQPVTGVIRFGRSKSRRPWGPRACNAVTGIARAASRAISSSNEPSAAFSLILRSPGLEHGGTFPIRRANAGTIRHGVQHVEGRGPEKVQRELT